MKEKETKLYVPLEIEIVEVLTEKGYATSGNPLGPMENDGYGW